MFTEKIDGTNIRVMWDGEVVSFGGKTDNVQLHMDLIKALQDMCNTTPNRKDVRELVEYTDQDVNVCLYGEGYGAGIQKGGCYREDKGFVLFDIKIGDLWLRREDVEDIATKLGIDVVPVIGQGTLYEGISLVKDCLHRKWGSFTMEGIVARPMEELRTRRGDRVITKIKHVDFKS